MIDGLLSVIIRSSSAERLTMLDQALFSIVTQRWQNFEIVVCLQNPDPGFLKSVAGLATCYSTYYSAKIHVEQVTIPTGIDGRADLLNRGLDRADGQYLAFLDDDDVIYTHGYRMLIEALRSNPAAALAAGRCRSADVKLVDGELFVVSKHSGQFDWGVHKAELLHENFIPIHSYVLDRGRIDPGCLNFEPRAVPLEDYDFLLRLANGHEFDLSCRGKFVCEYRFHAGSTLSTTSGQVAKQSPKLIKARQYINDRKAKTVVTMSHDEFVLIRNPAARSLAALHQERFLHRLSTRAYRFLDRPGFVQSVLIGAYRRIRGRA